MRLPSFLSGTLRIVVPKLNVWIGLACLVLAYVGMLSGQWLLLSIGIGGLGVMPITVACHWLGQWRFNRKAKDWPVSVQVISGSDGERLAFVTALDGTVSTLVIPDDYDPDDDGGEWLIREIAPGLAELIFEDAESDDRAAIREIQEDD